MAEEEPSMALQHHFVPPNEYTMVQAFKIVQEKHMQKTAPFSQKHYDDLHLLGQPRHNNPREIREVSAAVWNRRPKLRRDAQKGKKDDIVLAIVEWGGVVQSTLSIPTIEVPFDGEYRLLGEIWSDRGYTLASSFNRQTQPREPREEDWGLQYNPFSFDRGSPPMVTTEELFNFDAYYQDGAKEGEDNQAREENQEGEKPK